jgi:hypothetical protein
MRVVAKLIYDMMASDAPALVADFRVDLKSDGIPIVLRSGASQL